MTNTNRWSIAAAGVLMQVALGAVYAWSVFRIPLTKAHGWTIPEVTFAFELTIFVLGFASFAGGMWMKRVGPVPWRLVQQCCTASAPFWQARQTTLRLCTLATVSSPAQDWGSATLFPSRHSSNGFPIDEA